MNVRDLLRADPTRSAELVAEKGTDATPGVKNRKRAEKELAAIGPELAELATRLYAGAKFPGAQRLILLLQGTDGSGKDGVAKHVVGLLDPPSIRYTAFGKPTKEELAHDFLWRFSNAVPEPGCIGVFNRSQYEDVLVVRVHDLVPPEQWEQRYDLINAWEAEQVAAGVTFVKVYLHLSQEEQRTRLLDRIDDPTKRWKANPGDLAEREHWEDYRTAYAAMLERCSDVPWYVVPADHKWYRDWAVGHLLLETLRAMNPPWPTRPDLDLTGMRATLTG